MLRPDLLAIKFPTRPRVKIMNYNNVVLCDGGRDDLVVHVVCCTTCILALHGVVSSRAACISVVKSCLDRTRPHRCAAADLDRDCEVPLKEIRSNARDRRCWRAPVDLADVTNLAVVVEFNETPILRFRYIELGTKCVLGFPPHGQAGYLTGDVVVQTGVLSKRMMQYEQALIRCPKERRRWVFLPLV